MPSCLFIGAAAWVGAQHIGIGSAGTELEARSSSCLVESGAGEIACSTFAAAILNGLDNGNQDDSQRTYSAGAASITQAAFSPEFERGGAVAGDIQHEIEDAKGAPLEDPNDADEDLMFDDEEPQYIGEFIDPDSEDFNAVMRNEIVVSIGNIIDPDAEIYDILAGNRSVVSIGEAIDPDYEGFYAPTDNDAVLEKVD